MIADPDDPADRVRVQTHVRAPPDRVFRVFTEDIDRWWGRGPAYRALGKRGGVLLLEPFVGGRLFESLGTDDGPAVVTGRVTVFEPPTHLAFDWRAVPFAPDEWTTVDIRFDPTDTGTRITLVHAGWSGIRPDHPARHGQPAGPFLRALGQWWAGLLGSVREHAG